MRFSVRHDHDNQQDSARQAHLREPDLARRWHVSQRTLQRWRAEGLGPAYIRIGGAIRYRFADVLDFEARHRSEGGKE